MKGLKWFILGALFFSACGTAAISFPYKFYHISGNSYSGVLLGPTKNDDIIFTECKPSAGKQKCVVIFYTELAKIISDYKETKQNLIDCQKGKK